MATKVAQRKLKTAPGETVTYTVNGIKHRRRMLGGKWRLEIRCNGKWCMCLNESLPERDGQYIAHPIDGRCDTCNGIYSHLMRNAGQPCDECKLEAMAAMASAIEAAGIPLGWGYAGRGPNTVRPEWVYERAGERLKPQTTRLGKARG